MQMRRVLVHAWYGPCRICHACSGAPPKPAKGFRRKHTVNGIVCCVLPALIVIVVVPTRAWSFSNMWLTLVSGNAQLVWAATALPFKKCGEKRPVRASRCGAG